jgi:hypothetical protein
MVRFLDQYARQMGDATMLWAGKRLTDGEELALRRLVGTLRRTGEDELAASFERFLPENDHLWTPDELELGAHVGPWVGLGARPELDGKGEL